MTPSEFDSSPLSADEALERAFELELQARPLQHGFTKRSLVRQAIAFRALAEIRQFSKPAQDSRAA